MSCVQPFERLTRKGVLNEGGTSADPRALPQGSDDVSGLRRSMASHGDHGRDRRARRRVNGCYRMVFDEGRQSVLVFFKRRLCVPN